LALYQQTWGRLKKPSFAASPFNTASNWYRIGQRLAEKYDEANRPADAQKVRDALSVVGSQAAK
jgi:hypothetical protein